MDLKKIGCELPLLRDRPSAKSKENPELWAEDVINVLLVRGYRTPFGSKIKEGGIEEWQNDENRGKTNNSEEVLVQCHLVYHEISPKVTWD